FLFNVFFDLLTVQEYEDTWAALHRRAKECASAGELVDSEVVMLSAHWEKKKTSLVELQEQLQQLPGLIADLESMAANLTHLEASFEEVEDHLLNLENLCGQCELERYKHMQSQQLESYKKKKRKELETFKAELDAEHTQKVLEMEHTQQTKLKERQKFFEEAFQQDMEQYLSTGYLQIAERRGKLVPRVLPAVLGGRAGCCWAPASIQDSPTTKNALVQSVDHSVDKAEKPCLTAGLAVWCAGAILTHPETRLCVLS
uniref:Dystrobrevin binding protein 1 n=1 Tax=Panthera tigris altaica TaxID=74533 RepID=A0A8C9K3L0_PANTA